MWFRSFVGIHDRLVVEVSNDGGSTWTAVDSAGDTGGVDWRSSSFLVSDHVTPTANVRVSFITKDSPDDSFSEAGVDDFLVEQVDCCPWDCGDPADGEVTVLDFLAMLAQWGQPGSSCDFDGDGVGVTDFLILLGNWGPCQ
ncbi:MAG: hypothetical protein ACYSU7_03905, partial [Planctomycetota bacterium]|jgi:hypothetical protein